MTPEEEKELDKIWFDYWEDWEEEDKKQNEKWNKTKETLKEYIHPKYFDFAENNDSFYSEGIVEIEETNEKLNGYQNYKFCKIKNNQDTSLYMYTTTNIECYDFESKYEGKEVEYWVWQQTGHLGDDYSGFLLLPLLDGKRFWKVGYSC